MFCRVAAADLVLRYVGRLGFSAPCSSAEGEKNKLRQRYKSKCNLTSRVPEVSDEARNNDDVGNEVQPVRSVMLRSGLDPPMLSELRE